MSPLKVTDVSADFTRRLSCRGGDFLWWMRPRGDMFGALDADAQWEMPDYWYLSDGTTVLLTNRSIDLPEWIELHPSETAGALGFRTMHRLESGWTPSEPVDAPNIWRIQAGDRVAFTGSSRPGVSPDADGLVEIFDFSENAMIVGEGRSATLTDWLGFGDQGDRDLTPAEKAAGHAAVATIRRMGLPRTLSLEWYLER